MKRLGVFVLMTAMLLTLTACKSQAVKDVEAAINDIGTVSVESGVSISIAEQLLNGLPDDERGDVGNLNVLAEAREAYETLVLEKASEQLKCGDWVSALTNLETVDKETIKKEKDNIVSSLVQYLSNFAPNPNEIDAVSAGLSIMEMLEGGAGETTSPVVSVLTGMQEYLSETKILQDFETLEKQHGGVIAECLMLFTDGSYPERMAAIDFIDEYVPQIVYSGEDEIALKYIASLNDIRDGMNIAKAGINQKNNSVIQAGVEQIQAGAVVSAEYVAQVIANYEKEIKVLTAASELS